MAIKKFPGHHNVSVRKKTCMYQKSSLRRNTRRMFAAFLQHISKHRQAVAVAAVLAPLDGGVYVDRH